MLKIASLDVGLKRIGCAICLDKMTVIPQNAIIRKNRDQAARDVDKFLESFEIDTLVVGLPKGGESSDEMQRRIEHFISLLKFDKSLFYHDEYGSSQEAKELIKGVTKQKKDGKIDSIAAKIILERWLEFTP